MARSPIQLEDYVKAELERYKNEVFRVKTHSDAVSKLMEKVKSDDKEIKKLQESIRREKERHEKEDINLGEQRKYALLSLMKILRLTDIVDVFDFLIMHYETSDKVSREIIEWLRDKK